MLKQSIIAAIMLVGLAGCGGPTLSKNQRAEVENIAEDFADGAASDAAANVDNSELESKIDNLESRIASMGDEIARLREQNVEDINNISKLSKSMIEHERLYHGR